MSNGRFSVQHTEADIDKHLAAFNDIAASLAEKRSRSGAAPVAVAH